MRLHYHIVLSTFFFGSLFILGYEKNFVATAFIASLLIDIDHIFVGSIAGSYNPLKIIRYSPTDKTGKSDLRELRQWKTIGSRFIPFHNVWICIILLVLWFPVGVGASFHLIIDIVFVDLLIRIKDS
jgi:hypothetical protein